MNDNTKQSGDVKRWKIRLTLAPGLGPTGYEAFEKEDGPYVLFSDIAHLLKPQEPLFEGEPTYVVPTNERIEKLEGENRRLMAALEKIIKADQVLYQERRNERMVEIANEALNSGGVE